MKIVFAAGTTITQANALRLDHGLVLAPMGYQAPDGSGYNYGYADDSQYLKFARFYYGTTCNPCPPIMPVSAYYEPVSAEVEAALLADPRVAILDNRNDSTFFLHSDQGGDRPRMGTLAERPYWPSGVKLDSKIIIANDVAVRRSALDFNLGRCFR